jgi:hypothetical protein
MRQYRGPITVAFVTETTAPDTYGYLQDVLSGLNVRHYNYLVPDVKVEIDDHYDDRFDEVHIPFVVQRWYNGSIEEREWPEWQEWSFHRTRKGAEQEAAYLEGVYGTKPEDISIREDAYVSKWELEYHPIRD